MVFDVIVGLVTGSLLLALIEAACTIRSDRARFEARFGAKASGLYAGAICFALV